MNRFVKTVTKKVLFWLGKWLPLAVEMNNDVFELWGLIAHSLASFRKEAIKHLGLLWFYWHESSWSIDVKSPWAVSHVLGLAFETLSLWAWLSPLLPCGWIFSSEVENQKCSECFSLTPTKTWGDTHLTTFYKTYWPTVWFYNFWSIWWIFCWHGSIMPHFRSMKSVPSQGKFQRLKKTRASQHLITEVTPSLWSITPIPPHLTPEPSTPPHGLSSLRCRNLATVAASSLLLLSQLSWNWRCTCLSNKSKTNPADMAFLVSKHRPTDPIYATSKSPSKA